MLDLRQAVQDQDAFKSFRSVGGQVMVSKDSNIVLVVDDDRGMLKAVQRLLPLHAYEPILFVRSDFQQLS